MLISWSTAIASAVPRRLPALPILSNSHRQVKVRFGQEVGARAAWLPGFEFQTVTHTTGVIFGISRAVVTKRQFPQSRIFTRPEKPISLVPASLLFEMF